MINLPHFQLFREDPRTISRDAVWVIIHGGYLYFHPWFLGVLFQFLTEYKQDQHLVG